MKMIWVVLVAVVTIAGLRGCSSTGGNYRGSQVYLGADQSGGYQGGSVRRGGVLSTYDKVGMEVISDY